jgi:metal-sulfur cluster biosynthetic enzyme
MKDPKQIKTAILERLSSVIDPETGVDVVRMKLIEDLEVDDNGLATYKFRPSSPLCPIAIPLSLVIHQAVSEVEGVTGQELEIVGYVGAAQLTALLQEEFGKPVTRQGSA